MTLNLALLNRTLAFIEEHPTLHQQEWWSDNEIVPSDVTEPITEADVIADPETHVCGTTACFAGWATILGGYHQLRDGFAEVVVDETGRELHMEVAGQLVLGLTESQAYMMFGPFNTRARLAAMVAELNDNPDSDLDDVVD